MYPFESTKFFPLSAGQLIGRLDPTVDVALEVLDETVLEADDETIELSDEEMGLTEITVEDVL